MIANASNAPMNTPNARDAVTRQMNAGVALRAIAFRVYVTCAIVVEKTHAFADGTTVGARIMTTSKISEEVEEAEQEGVLQEEVPATAEEALLSAK